jgi:hypothetical protein
MKEYPTGFASDNHAGTEIEKMPLPNKNLTHFEACYYMWFTGFGILRFCVASYFLIPISGLEIDYYS